MRKFISLVCIVWIVLMIWFFIYDELRLFFYGRPTPAITVSTEEFDPLAEIFNLFPSGSDPKPDPDSKPQPKFESKKSWLVFTVVKYRFIVKSDQGNGQAFDGEDLYITGSTPEDMENLDIIYLPEDPEVSKVGGHLEMWTYGTAMVALILWMAMVLPRKRPVSDEPRARQPLKQFTAQFNQLKLKWEQLAPNTFEDDLQREAMTWSNDVLVLAQAKNHQRLIALARVFIIYISPGKPDTSKAVDATAVLTYDHGRWDTTGELVHKLPAAAAKKYSGYRMVHERIDENRDLLFEELLRRTEKPNSIPMPEFDEQPTPPTDEPPEKGESRRTENQDNSDQSKEDT